MSEVLEKVDLPKSINLVEEAILNGEFTGLADGISNEIYHKAPGLSFTGLKAFSITPADYQAYRKKESEPSDSQRLGTLVHMRVLEPELFEKKVVLIDGTWSFKVKEKVEEARAQGLYPCKTKERDKAVTMGDAIMNHPKARLLLQKGKAEQSCFWKDPRTGLLMKARPDYLRAEDGIIVDLKWFNDLREYKLKRQVDQMRYHWQSKFYLTGVGHVLGRPMNMFAHIFVQEEEPFNVRVTILEDASLDKAEYEITPYIDRFAQCLERNEWPGYPDEILSLTLPDQAW